MKNVFSMTKLLSFSSVMYWTVNLGVSIMYWDICSLLFKTNNFTAWCCWSLICDLCTWPCYIGEIFLLGCLNWENQCNFLAFLFYALVFSNSQFSANRFIFFWRIKRKRYWLLFLFSVVRCRTEKWFGESHIFIHQSVDSLSGSSLSFKSFIPSWYSSDLQVELLSPINGDVKVSVSNDTQTGSSAEDDAITGLHLFGRKKLESSSR